MSSHAPSDPPQTGWRNWSGSASAPQARRVHPATEADLARLLRESDGTVRPVGSGHSFAPLVPNDGIVLSLDRFGGPLVWQADDGVWVQAGARLRDLSAALQELGLAFHNVGDINVQTFAGATSTATHGTGSALPCLSAAITGLRLVTPAGEVLELLREREPDMLAAASVALGTFGVITAARVETVAAHVLRRRVWTAPLETVLAEAEDRWARHRHFEFLYVPFSGWCVCIAHDLTDAAPEERVYPDDDAAVLGLKGLRDGLQQDPDTRRAILSASLEQEAGEDVCGWAWQVLASPRNVLFNEAEAHLPDASWQAAFAEVVELIETRHSEVYVPIEVRRTAPDSAWLSPFHDGSRTSIAVHAGDGDPYGWLVDEVGLLMARHGARPHWGKLNGLTRDSAGALYPRFDAFVALRRQLDPGGRMLNAHLAALFA